MQFPEVDWLGLLMPLAYIGVLAGSLMTFSSIYRKRKAGMLKQYLATANLC
jgi:hypothetical protein